MNRTITVIASLLTALSLCLCARAAPPDGDAATLGDSATLGESAVTLGESEPRFVPVDGVLFPTEFGFTLDPFELSGRGQVFSEPIRIVNTNEFPITVGISGLRAVAVGEDVRLSEFPIDPNVSSREKDICLALRSVSGHGFDGELTLGASGQGVGFTLGESSEAVFELAGSINTMPAEPWEAGDVRVTMSFAALAPPDYALDPDDDGRIPEKEEPVFDGESA